MRNCLDEYQRVKRRSKADGSEDNSQLPAFSPEDEKEAQKELDRLRENENRAINVNRKRTGFEDKTLWDKLNLFGTLAIPIVVLIATIGFGLWQAYLVGLQHDSDQQRALDQQQAAILQTYIDNIQDLLLNHNLLRSKPDGAVAILARARTLTALHGLDSERKGRLLIFLYETHLIGFDDKNGITYDAIIVLSGADLSGAKLGGTNLYGVLFPTNLSGANLGGTNLYGAELYVTNLRHATLTGADLREANLEQADLSLAKITQQQLDQVLKCNKATLTGLICRVNQ